MSDAEITMPVKNRNEYYAVKIHLPEALVEAVRAMDLGFRREFVGSLLPRIARQRTKLIGELVEHPNFYPCRDFATRVEKAEELLNIAKIDENAYRETRAQNYRVLNELFDLQRKENDDE